MAEQESIKCYYCQSCATNAGLGFSQKMEHIESARCSGCHQGRLCNAFDVTHTKRT